MKEKLILNLKVFLIFLLAGQLPLAGDAFGAHLLDKVVATINDEVITWSELRRVIEFDVRDVLEGLDKAEREAKMRELEKPFLNKLIDMRLQLQEARKAGFDVTPSETDDVINEIKGKHNLTDEALKESLKKEGLTLEEYRTSLLEQILLSKIVNFEVKSKVFISEKDIEDYYEANKDIYNAEEKVKIRQIFFPAPEGDSIKAVIDKKAQGIIKRIEEGEDFAKLASEYSEDPSREFGGDLGYIKRGTVLKEVEEAAFALKRGEVSKPFRSSAGVHIVKVEDIVKRSGVEEAREKIKGVLFEKAFRMKHNEWVRGLREKAYIETFI
jgi:peptidyl-prolyl cis-trans isomerase SurA